MRPSTGSRASHGPRCWPTRTTRTRARFPGQNPIYFWWQDTNLDGTADTWRRARTTEFFNDPLSVQAFPQLYNYTDCNRGCYGRTPDLATLDLHGGYKFKIKDTTLNLALDIFNVFNSQEATSFDDFVESTAGIPDPDFLAVNGYQTPRFVRISAIWTF